MARRVDVYFLPAETDERDFAGRTAVVIDLLRASTTIVTALANGARDVIPTASPERAAELREELGRAVTLLCGERRGEKIPGFDLGNSPHEYGPDIVGGKRLLFASSNGSAAILAAREAARLAVGALVNARATVDWVCAEDTDCVLLCAGKLGVYAAEDAACAGHMVTALAGHGYRPGNDAARTARSLSEEARADWLSFVAGTDHGRYLAGLGFAADFPLVCAVDRLARVPVWTERRLALATAAAEA